MAAFCDLKAHRRNQKVMEMSGVTESRYNATGRLFTERFERMPHIDEIPGANSEPYLMRELHADKNGYTTPEDLERYTGNSDVSSAIQNINNTHTDLVVEGEETRKHVKLNISRRPLLYTNGMRKTTKPFSIDALSSKEMDSAFRLMCRRINDLYGADINFINGVEAQYMGVPDALLKYGFIKDGSIYINTDNATFDTPMHELMHIVMGTIKAHDRALYESLTDIITKNYDINRARREYPNRSLRDVQEEIFVDNVSKFLVGIDSHINSFTNEDLSEFSYMLARAMDSLIDGEVSVRTTDFKSMISNGMTVKQLADTFSSRVIFSGRHILDHEAARLSRINANKKEALIKAGLLIEKDC